MGNGSKGLCSWNAGIKPVPKSKLYRGLRGKWDIKNVNFPLVHRHHCDVTRSEDGTRMQEEHI